MIKKKLIKKRILNKIKNLKLRFKIKKIKKIRKWKKQ